MALKKPSELFSNESKKKVEIAEQSLPENYNIYKSNVKNVEVLNDFISSYGTLRENLNKIDILQDGIQSLKEELQNTITKEDLNSAIVSNLLVLEENIQKIEYSLKGINRKDLKRIDEEIENIESKIVYVLEEEFPKYKKSLKSNEIFIKDKFYEYSNEVNEKVTKFQEFVKTSFKSLQENLQVINDTQLIDIRESVVNSSKEFERLSSNTKKQIFSVEKDVKEFYQKIKETISSYQKNQNEKISKLEESISSFETEEVKKYQSLLQEIKIQNDKKIQSFENVLIEKYETLTQSVNSLDKQCENYQDNFLELSETIQSLTENISDIQNDYLAKENIQNEIDSIHKEIFKKINLLENDISFKETKIKKTNQELVDTIQGISSQVDSLNVGDLEEKYFKLSNKISYIEEVFEKFNEKVILNEGLLNEPPTVQNSDPLTPLNKNFVTLDQLQEHYRLFINRIQQQLSTIGGGGETRLEFLDDVDRNSAKVNGRFLKYDAASGKWVGALGGGGGSQDLDITLEFGNTSSLGMSVGVVTATSFVKSQGTSSQFLKADGSVDTSTYATQTYVGLSTAGLASTTYVNNAVVGFITSGSLSGYATQGYVDSKVGLSTVGLLSSTGNGSSLTGIVTSITAGSGISIDQSTGNVTITSTGVGGGGESYWDSTVTGINTLSNVGIGTTAKSDFKLYVEGNTKITGILTVGNQSVTIDGSNNTIKVGSGITINGNTGIISATAVYIDGNQISTFSGDYNDLTNKPDLSNISVSYVTSSGIATYASTAGIATNATYATSSGISTYATNAGIATYATSSGIATYAPNAGIATYATSSGISTEATRLKNTRTFEISGDIVASAVSFDGTGNVSLAATIQPNSVTLGNDTTGDYIQSISGTTNQITVTGGTGETSTPILSIPNQFTAPQDVTITRDLQINRNLNVNGSITIGGTSATLFTSELKVYDPDIVLGLRTDGSGNDISTDNTANHGGIAIASTEGTPLISLYDVGVGETNPSTYKKFMWFKSGTFSGLGTDAWLSNYAIGIGSTQVPNGVRLAAGSVQFTENDLTIVRNINASGFITATTFVGSIIGTATTATNLADAANITTGTINSARLSGTYSIDISGNATTSGYATTAGIATVAQGLAGTPNIVVGIVTATSYNGSGSNLTGIVTSITAGDGISVNQSTGNVTITAPSKVMLSMIFG